MKISKIFNKMWFIGILGAGVVNSFLTIVKTIGLAIILKTGIINALLNPITIINFVCIIVLTLLLGIIWYWDYIKVFYIKLDTKIMLLIVDCYAFLFIIKMKLEMK